MRLGVAHHLGWAVAVTATDGHEVADRRRVELVEAGTPTAPVHNDPAVTAAQVAQVRASAVRATTRALDELVAALPEPVTSISLREWPEDFPTDIQILRRPPYEARADSVMYRQVLAELARARGWEVHTFDATDVEARASDILGARTHDVLHGPRAALGPPWNRDHRIALAATVVAGGTAGATRSLR